MICPVCIANAALAVAGAATSGGTAAMALQVLRQKRGVKRKAEGGFLISPGVERGIMQIARYVRERHR
jgi:hypothetical protein